MQQDKPVNPIFVGGNGISKTTIAKNIAYQAAISNFLQCDVHHRCANAQRPGSYRQRLHLKRRLKYYAQPQLLVIDGSGTCLTSNRHADLLFEIVNRRYEIKSTLVFPTVRSQNGTKSSQCRLCSLAG